MPWENQEQNPVEKSSKPSPSSAQSEVASLSEAPRISFRPHHFLCTLGFQGKGYSPEFVTGYQKIADLLRSKSGDETEIEVVESADSICAPCPHKRGTGCESQERITHIDAAHAEVLGLRDGERLTWGEAKERIRQKMTVEKFNQACSSCGWKSWGVCEQALRGLIAGCLLILCLSQGAFANADQADWARYQDGESQLAQAEKALKTGSPTFASERARAAMDLFGRIPVEKPDSSLIGRLPDKLASADFLIARAYLTIKRKPEAMTVMERGFSRLSDERITSRVPLGILSLYTETCTSERTPRCIAWVKKLASRYPSVSQEFIAIKKAAQAKIDLGTVRLSFDYKTTPYRTTNNKDFEAFDQAFALYINGDDSDALIALGQFLNEYPKSAYAIRARYWIGRILKKQEKEDDAERYFINIMADAPLTYYAILSSFETEVPLQGWVSSVVPKIQSEEPGLEPRDAWLLGRAKKWISEKRPDRAATDLRLVSAKRTMSNEFLRYLAQFQSSVGNHLSAFGIISELLQRGDVGMNSSMGTRMIFPIVDWDMIRKQAGTLKLDPILVLSLIKQESAFEAEALSSSGAQGYMQLMPATAVEVEPSIEQMQLLDTGNNIRVGSKYLASMIARFKGNWSYALAAYNAGPSRVDTWREADTRTLDMAEFIETIPYRETRDYVSGIARNYYWYYFKLRGEKVRELEELFWND